LSAQEIVNWVTTADGCVHTDDTTKLSPTSCEFVFTPPTPTTKQFRPLGVGGVYCALCCNSVQSMMLVIDDDDDYDCMTGYRQAKQAGTDGE